MLGYSEAADFQACKNTLAALESISHDRSDIVRRRVYQSLVVKVFGPGHEELRNLQVIPSNEEPILSGPGISRPQNEGLDNLTMDFYHQNLELLNVHEDMTNLVNDSFDPNYMGYFGQDELPGGRMF